jgi:hypothetical protein
LSTELIRGDRKRDASPQGRLFKQHRDRAADQRAVIAVCVA